MGKSTLHVFGDSFSEPIDILAKHNTDNSRCIYSREYLNTETYPIWSELLAESLNMTHINHAGLAGYSFKKLGQGNSNLNILFNLNQFAHEFKKGDIVIVGFTDVVRFPWQFDNNSVRTYLPNDYGNDRISYKRVLDFIAIRRDEDDFYKEELFQNMKVFEHLSDVIGFQLYYWSWYDLIINYKLEEKILDKKWIIPPSEDNYYSLNNVISSYGPGSIAAETKGKINDCHYGKIGNEVQHKLFLDYIKKQKQ